jgi:hypothetical protein
MGAKLAAPWGGGGFIGYFSLFPNPGFYQFVLAMGYSGLYQCPVKSRFGGFLAQGPPFVGHKHIIVGGGTFRNNEAG